MQLGCNRASQEYRYKIILSVWWPFGVDGWIFQRQNDEMRTLPELPSDAFREWWNMLKLLFPHGPRRLFPLHFKMRFWSWKSGRSWLMSSFYQKQQEFISGKTPIRRKKWHTSVHTPRGLQDSPDILLAQKQFSANQVGSQKGFTYSCRMRQLLLLPCRSADGKFSQSDARKPTPAECTSAMLQVHPSS